MTPLNNYASNKAWLAPCKSTQNNKFANSLQYLKKEVRDGVAFVFCCDVQCFMTSFLMTRFGPFLVLV